jgi:hypothetical protein
MQANVMSNLFALGSRPIQSPLLRATQEGGAAGAQTVSASGKVPARLPVVDPVSLSSGSVTLTRQALNAQLDHFGDKTVAVAQRFIGNVAQSLFGDAAQGATFALDAISVAADTSLSATVQTDAIDVAALQLNASASFVGRGAIATGDGQSFNVELEVKYASAQQPAKAPDTLTLTGKPLPEITFPGSLADLFKLLGRQLDASATSGKNDGNGGDLSLRLLRLVNSAALLAPHAPADSPAATPAERNRALASYATPAASGTVITA